MAEPGNGPALGDGDFERLDGFLTNGEPDEVDFRDFDYRPSLRQLEPVIEPPDGLEILNQGSEGACTGFGLAAAINLLLARRGDERRVSARMLYEMAKKHDRWEGMDYSGSSCRGAIKGWHSMGVTSEDIAQYVDGELDWSLTIDQAKDARETTLGAYYRVGKRISDYHSALNEAGVLFASARVHPGWQKDNVVDGVIPYGEGKGGHAFAIVGYNQDGFCVQNSWGPEWGDKGKAIWTYEDWLQNGRDAWVLALALPTPKIWHLPTNRADDTELEEGLFDRSPKRAEVVGHFAHIDDGKFDENGRYWTDLHTVQTTADHLVTEKSMEKYQHLLFYAHGGLNSTRASARRVVAMKEVFKDNGVYPFHFMYDTGLTEEIKDIVLGRKEQVEQRTEGFTDYSDRFIENSTRPAGRALWREMKAGAARPFEDDGAGNETITAFLDTFAEAEYWPKIHLVGHSTGAILLASLLESLERLQRGPLRIKTCSLMAPACTHELFARVYLDYVRSPPDAFGIDQMTIYNLDKDLELGDTVTPVYRKSLLYLVSNAFEEQRGEPILGMQKFENASQGVDTQKNLAIKTSDGRSAKRNTTSKTHGGFDNDEATMNSVLRAVLGLDENPERHFTKEELEY